MRTTFRSVVTVWCVVLKRLLSLPAERLTNADRGSPKTYVMQSWCWVSVRHLSRMTFILGGFTCLLYLTTMGSLVQVVTFPDPAESGYCMGEEGAKPGIPKQIHQMWKSHDVPAKWQARTKHCRELNPSYNYTLWSDDDIVKFLEENYAWFLPTYKSYPYPISRPDAARYFILYHYGGVYMDLDIACKVPFDQIVNVSEGMDAVVAATAPFGITNNFMASQKGSTLLRYIVQGLVAAKGWYVVPHMTVMMSAGPLYVFSRYNSYPCKERVKVISVEEHKNFFQHEQAATWHNWDGRVVVWMDHHHRLLIIGFIIAAIVSVLGLLRYSIRAWRRRRDECSSLSPVHVIKTFRGENV